MNRAAIAAWILAGTATIGTARADWHIVVPEQVQQDEAVRVCLEDLRETGNRMGVRFTIVDKQADVPTPAILVGAPARNPQAAAMASRGAISLEGVDDPQGYEIKTAGNGDERMIVVAGGSVVGDVYGLYWIWDRMRVERRIPDINVTHMPVLPVRYTRVRVHSRDDLRRALRCRLNLVYGDDPLNLVPWSSEPGATSNEGPRKKARELAAYAHALHMKFLAFGTDVTYHPSLLKEFGATPSACDPAFWNALQAKYRRLFQAVPELDGLGTFTGDERHYWGDYAGFDVMHEDEGCDWSLEKRYRTFVTKVHEVVVGEFDKLHLHRTWTTNAYEQHSQPDVYRRTFTSEVPTRNLYLIPSFTNDDRWWHQAYNTTVNLTPHDMMVVLESMDYHAGGNVFPTYPGRYYRAGLQTMLDVESSNLKGASFDLRGGDGWNTPSLTAYTAARLTWDHHTDPESIAEDFASIHFGPKAAKAMGEILLLSPVAYKYGLYIEPMTHGAFSTLPHIRVAQFVAHGYPSIDQGREHIEFLRTIYLRCKPWIAETLAALDHGLETARLMEEKYQRVKPLIEDGDAAEAVETTLRMTRALIETNNLYMRTCFSYFAYREKPTAEGREQLRRDFESLTRARDAFRETPGFGFQLFGVEWLLRNVTPALRDLPAAEKAMAAAPTSAEIEAVVAKQQKQYRRVLEQHRNEAVKVLHCEARVDGRDLILVRGERLETRHLRWDGITVSQRKFFTPLPDRAVTVIPHDIESRPMHPFILEQPSRDNDFTATVYLYDVPGGAGWFRLDLYYLPGPPDKYGLALPWQTTTGSKQE